MLQGIFKPAAALCIICVIVTAALSYTNAVTAPKIEAGILERENKMMRQIADFADSFEAAEIIESGGNATAGKTSYGQVRKIYKAYSGEELKGYIFNISVKGYAGEIRIIAGLSSDGKITGVKIVSNSETPGLGSKVAKAPFTSQFAEIIPQRKLTVVKSPGVYPEEIDSVSGATISSRAVTNGVQAAVDMLYEIKSGKVVIR